MSTAPRRQRPLEVRAMALMCLLSAVCAAAASAAPMTEQTPAGLIAACSAVALVLAGLVWWSRDRWVLHCGLLAHVLGLSGLVASAATGTGAAGGTVCYVWVALYASFFLGRRTARACSGLIALTLGAALLANPFVGALQLWFLVSVTTLLATEVVGSVVGRLDRAAVTDPLTGALNRQGLAGAAARALVHAGRAGEPMALVLLDLDDFKAVNDREGHAAGDDLLVGVVRAWREALRGGDVLARQGGDEFVLLLPDTDGPQAHRLLTRLHGVSPTRWSAGVAVRRPDDDLDALLLRADTALYAAKRSRPRLPRQRDPESATAPDTTRAGHPAR